MPTYGPKEYAMILVGMGLQFAIAWLMLHRNLHHRWPGFFAYTVFHVVQSPLDLIGVLRHWQPLTYFYFFYAVEAVSLALSFVVIYEVFQSVLGPYDALERIQRQLFFVSTAVLLVFGAIFAIFGPGSTGARVFKIVFYSEQGLRIVQIGLLLLLFTLARSLALNWRSYTFGIALGYGLYACVQLVLVVLRLKYVDAFLHTLSLINSLSYFATCAIWLRYIAQPQQASQPLSVFPHPDIERWNETLEGMLQRKNRQKRAG